MTNERIIEEIKKLQEALDIAGIAASINIKMKPTLYESPIGTRFRYIEGAKDLHCANAHWVKVGNETDIMTGRDTGNCICVLVVDGRFVIDDEILNGNTIPVPMW